MSTDVARFKLRALASIVAATLPKVYFKRERVSPLIGVRQFFRSCSEHQWSHRNITYTWLGIESYYYITCTVHRGLFRAGNSVIASAWSTGVIIPGAA